MHQEKGLFIASGIIKDKKDSVLSKYLENGFDCEQIVEEGEWGMIVFICPCSLRYENVFEDSIIIKGEDVNHIKMSYDVGWVIC